MTQPQWQATDHRYVALKLERAQTDGSAGDVYRILLNRPDALNALDSAMFEEIPQAVKQAEQDGARALIITGAGRGFCAGADLVAAVFNPNAPMADQQARARGTFVRVVNLVNAINQAKMPVITAINGVAAGGGVGIALAGDMALMSRSARFVLTFLPKLGLVPDVSATWLMARAAGRARTIGASLTGDAISAEQAERWGLVWRCVDDEALGAEAYALAERLANGPQAAVRETRKLIDAACSTELAEHLALERDAQCELIGAPDNIEGILAFREKRPANFRGKVSR